MGYSTSVTGSIEIHGDVNYAAIADSRFEHAFNTEIGYAFEESTVNVPQGVLTVKKLIAIVPATDERYKAYDIETHVQEAVDEITSANDAVVFDGYLEGHGEDYNDHWRLMVINGKAVKVKGTIIYDLPDH